MTALSARTNLVSGVNNTNAETALLAMYDALNEATEKPELDIASASTCDIGAMASTKLRITGTTTITSFGTVYRGPIILRMAAALTITYNATTLVCPGNASLVTAAGDVLMAFPKTTTSGTSNGWQVVLLSRASATMATQAPSSVAITGGSITGITDLAIADGGTGQSTAAGAFNAIKQAATDTATGVVELATGTERIAGTDTARAVTPAALAYGHTAAVNGQIWHAGSILEIWGTHAVNTNIVNSLEVTITFPVAFPGAAYNISANIYSTDSGADRHMFLVRTLLTQTQAKFIVVETATGSQLNWGIEYRAMGK